MSATMVEIAEEVAVNPDAQSAVTDFLDYTEYLPADLFRSLKLIRQLDETYTARAQSIHELTQTYGRLPSIALAERPDPRDLRWNISRQLDLAVSARESAYAEAVRLYDLTDRHQDRLRSILGKLNALPKPPSRDPTPQPQDVKKASTRSLEFGTRSNPKTQKGLLASTILPRPGRKRVTVPGEVQPAYDPSQADPDQPIASTETSDWENEVSSLRPVLKFIQPRAEKPRVNGSESISAPAAARERKAREPRDSTSFRKPTPPPEHIQLGSKHAPWLQLSEYEMYKLRKKMKKNNTWDPSDAMIRKELLDKGRGLENYYKARASAHINNTPFIDLEGNGEQLVSQQSPQRAFATKPERPKVKKSELKKEKVEDVAREQVTLASQEADQTAKRMGDISTALRNLFSPLSTALASLKTPTLASSSTKPVQKEKNKKRKLDETASQSPSVEPEGREKKKLKLLPKPSPLIADKPALPTAGSTASAGTIKIPLKLNVTPAASSSRPTSAGRSQSYAVKPDAESRPPSRRSAASAEPGLPLRGRSSTTPIATHRKNALDTTPRTSVARRSKREAPGTVTQSSQDGGAAVSVSKRQHKPIRGKAGQRQSLDVAQPQIRTDIEGNTELVNPDEERYCICGDVSWGEMIQCELEEKCDFGIWFHMDCVSLAELPPRTMKWYCPGDRKRLHKGQNTNGLVGRGIR